MPDPSQDLLRLKEHIDNSKTEAARIEGQIAQLEQQRASEFAVTTDAQAETYIKELEADVARLEADLEAGVQSVKEQLNWTQ